MTHQVGQKNFFEIKKKGFSNPGKSAKKYFKPILDG